MSDRKTDICIIGSGPAGAIVGARLVSSSSVKVILVESGRRYALAERAVLRRRLLAGVANPWEAEAPTIEALSLAPGTEYPSRGTRLSGLGGTSLHWDAETPRLHADDFRLRSKYGVGQDWPISYEEIEPYYGAAESELGVAGGLNPFASPRSAPYPLPAFPYSKADAVVMKAAATLGWRFHPVPQARASLPYRGRAQCAGCNTCEICPTGAKTSVDLTHIPAIEAAPGGLVLPNTTFLRFEIKGDRISRAIVVDSRGTEKSIEASAFVLAAGGIENARLLLLTKPGGLANGSGLVGRGFFEHPQASTTALMPVQMYPYRPIFSTATCEQFVHSSSRSREAAWTVFISPVTGELPGEIATRSEAWGVGVFEELRQRFPYAVRLDSMIEMLADDANRVELDPNARDRYGRPLARLSFAIGEYELAGIRAAQLAHAQLLQAAGATHIQPISWLGWHAHHYGTTRAGTRSERSVVDANLRCHDIHNLFVAGSSTFVTGGVANPTLTIAALSLRLGDFLIESASHGKLA